MDYCQVNTSKILLLILTVPASAARQLGVCSPSLREVVPTLTIAYGLVYIETLLTLRSCAVQLEDSEGRVGVGEREFLISPTFGSLTMTAAGARWLDEKRHVTRMKPFDWMKDEQYNNLQLLAIHYEV